MYLLDLNACLIEIPACWKCQVRSDSTQDLSFARGEGDRLSVLPRHLSDNMHFRPGMTPDGQKDFAKKDNALLSSQSTIPFGIGQFSSHCIKIILITITIFVYLLNQLLTNY